MKTTDVVRLALADALLAGGISAGEYSRAVDWMDDVAPVMRVDVEAVQRAEHRVPGRLRLRVQARLADGLAAAAAATSLVGLRSPLHR